MIRSKFLALLVIALASGNAFAEACTGYGPQTPRDIDSLEGTNKRIFSLAPESENMNLCNIHFHVGAEHKAKDFSLASDKGGFACGMSENLTRAELKKPKQNFCQGIEPGDTIEVHWVFSAADVKPGKGLGACLNEGTANPNLRVETQVFTVVNDTDALDFNDLDYDGNQVNGYHQPKMIPANTGAPVEFHGSTTGPSYTEEVCSPLQVSWSVRPQCAKLDINSLSKWCESNEFEENKAHGVRELVTNPELLSPI
jgi:carbonic anhydrase